jgi:hypothetical protein
VQADPRCCYERSLIRPADHQQQHKQAHLVHGLGKLEDRELPCGDEGNERAGSDGDPLAGNEPSRSAMRLCNVLGVVTRPRRVVDASGIEPLTPPV